MLVETTPRGPWSPTPPSRTRTSATVAPPDGTERLSSRRAAAGEQGPSVRAGGDRPQLHRRRDGGAGPYQRVASLVDVSGRSYIVNRRVTSTPREGTAFSPPGPRVRQGNDFKTAAGPTARRWSTQCSRMHPSRRGIELISRPVLKKATKRSSRPSPRRSVGHFPYENSYQPLLRCHTTALRTTPSVPGTSAPPPSRTGCSGEREDQLVPGVGQARPVRRWLNKTTSRARPAIATGPRRCPSGVRTTLTCVGSLAAERRSSHGGCVERGPAPAVHRRRA